MYDNFVILYILWLVNRPSDLLYILLVINIILLHQLHNADVLHLQKEQYSDRTRTRTILGFGPDFLY